MKLRNPPKANTSLAKTGSKPVGLGRGSSLIKKAISDSKEATTENKSDDTEINQEEGQGANQEAKQETETEKKKNLDRLLKRGLTSKTAENKDSKKDTDKKNTNKEWQENSKAKEGEEKSRFQRAREQGFQDELRNDKDSIAKKYPGIERPGAGSRSGGGSQQQQQNQNSNGGAGNSGNGGVGGNSGVSRLAQQSNGGSGSSNGSGGLVNNQRFSQTTPGFRQNQNFGNNGFVNQRPNNNLGNRFNDLKPIDEAPNTRTAFKSLFANNQVSGKEIHAKSVDDANRIASSLRKIGAFENVETNGSSINVSGFNKLQSDDAHKAHGQVLGKEFLQGNISGFSFNDLDPETASTLQGLLSERADQLGSTNHNINSSCDDGVCHVNVNQSQEAEQSDPQIHQEEQESNIA
jgi:hypothetical protein